MQVNSVSLSSNANNTAFKASLEEQVFASLSNRDLRNMAWAQASEDVNDRKHRRLDKALLLSLPLAGGLSALASTYTPEIAKLGTKNIRSFRALEFARATTAWGAGLAALGLLINLKNSLANKFDVIKNNPVTSFIATFVAGFGVVAAVNKAGAMGFAKLIKSIDEKALISGVLKTRRILNNNKVLNNVSEFMSKFPSPIKDIAKFTAGFSPLLVIGTQIGHTLGHQSVKAKVANKNYEELQQARTNIREFIADEKINNSVHKKTIADLHNEYEQMLNSKPIMDAQTNKPITFEQYVKLATTYVK